MRSNPFRYVALSAVIAVLAACAAPAGSPEEPAIGIEPRQGSAGTEVVVTASGFPPDRAVEIGFGPPASEYDVITQARTEEDGTITERVRVPSWAEAGRDYVFVVAEANAGPGRMKLISEPFSTTSATPSPAPAAALPLRHPR